MFPFCAPTMPRKCFLLFNGSQKYVKVNMYIFLDAGLECLPSEEYLDIYES